MLNTFPAVCKMLTVLFFSTGLKAQIIYTDIPDATPNASYSLDLNNDATVDFIIQFDAMNGTTGIICYPQNNNAYSGDLVGGMHTPWALPASLSICDSLTTWYDANNPGTMALGTTIGYWVGETNKYLALKLVVGTSTFFGWARFDVTTTSSSFTIKDYAYESTPNVCIQSGQSTLAVDERSTETQISIYPNPCSSSTTIQTNGLLKNAGLTIINAFGQSLKHIANISGNSVSLSRDDLPSGLYFIQLTEENKVIAVEKFIISD